MAYDPTLPRTNSPNSSAEMRAQLTGLKAIIDTYPTLQTVLQQIEMRCGSAAGVTQLQMTVSDPPTQSEVQTIADKLDELIAALQPGV